ncbi:MAG: hypothetical protein IK114_11425 [Fibrobacter sp.]|nr:hypothetical protein [Fibrobacter sp.]
MKNKVFIAMTAAVAMAALTACGDSGTSAAKSKATECANGLSAECLQGTWSLVGIAPISTDPANPGAGEILTDYNYSAAPGVMTFNEDGTFQFDLPQGAPEGLKTVDCNPVYGTWTVSEANLTLKSTVNGMCLGQGSITVTPLIKPEGAVIKMSLGTLWLMENVTDQVDLKATTTEVFTISAN